MKTSTIFSLLFAFSCSGVIYSFCSNKCSGHGMCTDDTVGECECFAGYSGGDCSQRVCPSGRAWADFPTNNNTAHADFTECSNMGTCDRLTGTCKCYFGYSGAACDSMLCPHPLTTYSVKSYGIKKEICSGNGRCISLREANLDSSFVSVGTDNVPYSGWDADMIFGCACDDGYEGPECERRSCPKGDDPLTVGYDDVQLLDCRCTSCQGGVILYYQGKQTNIIPYDASEQVVAYYLRQLSAFLFVEVQFREGSTLCSTQGSILEILFRPTNAVKAPISVYPVDGLAGSIIDIQWQGGARSKINSDIGAAVGTREHVECSQHGTCDYITGICNCFSGYTSSDGINNLPGNVGDCGYRESLVNTYTYSNSTETVHSSCPFVNNAVCSGNGYCNEPFGLCVCDSGFVGPACANLSCATSFTWFGKVNAAHAGVSVCGGVGICNGETGLCTNCGGNFANFYGAKCQYLSCPGQQQVGGGASTTSCSGNGACLTMKELALLTYDEQKKLSPVTYEENWDADHIRGCACTRAISIDGQFDSNYDYVIDYHSFNVSTNASTSFTTESLYKFYRGPYAFAATDFAGFDCGNALCPKGDNAKSRGENEIQELHCLANNGTFQLTFRENTTMPISYNATAEELKKSLEQLYTISQVEVTMKGHLYNRNHSICNIFDNITVYIEFLTEPGDVPLLQMDVSKIQNYGFSAPYTDNFVMNITEFRKGTKFELECSAQGVCDEKKGICSCFDGYSSSNGTLTAPGERGDCSFFNPLLTDKYMKKK